MRVLFVNKFLHPNGGSEAYIFKLGEYLLSQGHEVQYFGMEHKGRCVGNRVNAYTSDMDFHDGSKLSNCCLVSDIPACAEVIEDKAVCFPRGSVEGLREALQRLLDKPEVVEQYKREAADFICQKYSWDDVVDRTLEIYRR